MATTGTMKSPARIWRILLGVFFLLMLVGNAVRREQEPAQPVVHGDIAGALGTIFGAAIPLFLGVWLIRSGLPKTLDFQNDLTKSLKDSDPTRPETKPDAAPHRPAKVVVFFLGVAKLALAFFLALGVLAAGAWGLSTYQSRKALEAEAKLAVPKQWTSVTVEALDRAQLQLTTMWRAGRIYIQFRVNGYPPVIDAAVKGGSDASFTLVFLDAHGFRLGEKKIPVNSMTRLIGKDGPSGLDWKFDADLSGDIYGSVSAWEPVWSGFPDLAKHPSADDFLNPPTLESPVVRPTVAR